MKQQEGFVVGVVVGSGGGSVFISSESELLASDTYIRNLSAVSTSERINHKTLVR